MYLKKVWLFIFFCFSLFASDLKIFTEELPPYNYVDNGVATGISTLFLKKIIQVNNTPIKDTQIILEPWQIGYETVLEMPNTMIFSTAKFQNREKLFKWVGPIDTLIVGVIAKKSRKIKIKSPQDFNKYTIGVLHKTTAEILLQNLEVADNSLDRFSNIQSQLKKLATDRIDMVAFGYEGMCFVQKNLGIDPKKYELVYVLKKADLYFAFNKQTKNEYIEKLNQIAARLKKQGFIKKIKQEYGLR